MLNEEYAESQIDPRTYSIVRMSDLKPYLLFATPMHNNNNYCVTIASIETDDPYSSAFVTFRQEIYSFNIYTRISVEHILCEVLKALVIPSFNIEYPEVLINVFGGTVNSRIPQWRSDGIFH